MCNFEIMIWRVNQQPNNNVKKEKSHYACFWSHKVKGSFSSIDNFGAFFAENKKKGWFDKMKG